MQQFASAWWTFAGIFLPSALMPLACPTKPGFCLDTHEAAYERFPGLQRPASLRDLAALLRHTLQRIRTITEDFHLVLHTSPNTLHRTETLGYWKTIDEDYHWHIEILPIMAAKARSYTFKEVYFSPLTSETAAKRLREAKVDQ